MHVFKTHLLVNFVSILLLGTTSCSIEQDLDKEEESIRKVWSNVTYSICSGKWKMFSEVWDHSKQINVVHPHSGEWLKGWEDVSRKYETLLNSGWRCTLKKNDLTLHISQSGDMAWGTVDMIVQFNDSLKTTNHPWQTVVFEKKQGEWKLVYLLSALPKLE